MGVQVFESEVVLAVPPSKLFKAVAHDFPHLIVKIMPNVIKNVEFVNGNGGAGTIRHINLHEGISSVKTMKERIDAIDEEKLFYSLTVTEGEFPKGVEKIQNDVTFVATPDGAGTIVKRKIHIYTTSGDQIDETGIKAIDENAKGIFKGIEAYLLANPDA